MIAAHHDPGRGGQKRRGRLEKIGVPGIPTLTPRAAGTAHIADRAGSLAVFVIADMNHQVGAGKSRSPRNLRKRPGIWVIARLRGGAVEQPAAAISENYNALRIGSGER